jgi:hypothetical protein
MGFDDKTIEVETTKFLGLLIDSNLNWKTHIQYIIPILSSACFAMRTVTSIMKIETLKLVYFAYFHSIMSYGIIFWGNSTDRKKVFYIQKRIIRIMSGAKRRASCRELFNKFNILPLASEFLLSLSSCVVDNVEKFQTNSEVQDTDITSMSQILTSVNIKKEFTNLELSYSIIFKLM